MSNISPASTSDLFGISTEDDRPSALHYAMLFNHDPSFDFARPSKRHGFPTECSIRRQAMGRGLYFMEKRNGEYV